VQLYKIPFIIGVTAKKEKKLVTQVGKPEWISQSYGQDTPLRVEIRSTSDWQ